MPIVIGLCGPAGAGKSTIAEYLQDVYGAKRYSLAEPLKDIAARTLDFTHEQLYGTQSQKEAIDPRYGFSPRWFLQKLGTDGCRGVLGSDIWVNALLRRIRTEAPKYAVVEDVRFPNEADAIRGLFGTYQEGAIWRLHPVDTVTSMHESERAWENCVADYEFVPFELGIGPLYQFANLTATRCGMFPTRREVAL